MPRRHPRIHRGPAHIDVTRHLAMRCSVALLAESAATWPDGHLDVRRGGLRDVVVTELPARVHAWLVLVVDFDAEERGRDHRLYVDVVDTDGHPLGYRMSRPIKVGRDEATVPVTVPVSVLSTHADELTVRARLDSAPIADLPIRVVVAPSDGVEWRVDREPGTSTVTR